MTITTRIGFAMARDRALPFSHVFNYVYSRHKTKIPDRMILLVLGLNVFLLLLPLQGLTPPHSTTAFQAITSITTICFQLSYAIPILLRVTTARHSFQPRNFSLGRLSLPIGIVSSLWLTLTSVFFMLPNSFHNTAERIAGSFNYTPVVLLGFLAGISLHWICAASQSFKGARPALIKNETMVELSRAIKDAAVKI